MSHEHHPNALDALPWWAGVVLAVVIITGLILRLRALDAQQNQIQQR